MAPKFLEHFADLPDPRRASGRRHLLGDILAISLCAVVCGAEDWSGIVEFGEAREEWFRTFLDLPHGIASEDTFARVFAALDPEAFERCFVSQDVAPLVRSRQWQGIHSYGQRLGGRERALLWPVGD
jgi:hypothetical protein